MLSEPWLMKPDASSNKQYWFAVYECPYCMGEMLVMINNVKYGRTTKCDACRRNSINIVNLVRLAKARDEFIAKAEAVHGKEYYYTLVDYVTARRHVKVGCYKHGPWNITPDNHLRGNGCNLCAFEKNTYASRYESEQPTILYVLYLPEHHLFKIGCTIRSVDARYSQDHGLTYTVAYERLFEHGKDAYGIEQDVLTTMLKHKYIGPKVLKGGNSELLLVDPKPFIQQALSKLSV